jgi:hypothetical protein
MFWKWERIFFLQDFLGPKSSASPAPLFLFFPFSSRGPFHFTSAWLTPSPAQPSFSFSQSAAHSSPFSLFWPRPTVWLTSPATAPPQPKLHKGLTRATNLNGNLAPCNPTLPNAFTRPLHRLSSCHARPIPVSSTLVRPSNYTKRPPWTDSSLGVALRNPRSSLAYNKRKRKREPALSPAKQNQNEFNWFSTKLARIFNSVCDHDCNLPPPLLYCLAYKLEHLSIPLVTFPHCKIRAVSPRTPC